MNSFVIYTASFFLFSFIGWMLECFWCTIGEVKKTKKLRFVNRGFLTGPFCPIYGCTSILMELILRPFENNLVAVFFLGILLGDSIEYLTSYTMEKIFNARWWDYSNRFLNLNGRICLQHTVMWGFLCIGFVKVVSPTTFKLIEMVPINILTIVVFVILALFIIDFFIAVVATIDINVLRTKIRSIINETDEKTAEPNVNKEVVEIGSAGKNNLNDRIREFKNKVNSIPSPRRLRIKRILRQAPSLKEQINNQFYQLRNSIDITDDIKEAFEKMKKFFVEIPEEFEEEKKRNKKNKKNKK